MRAERQMSHREKRRWMQFALPLLNWLADGKMRGSEKMSA
jgi:hypothetical protein